MPKVNIKCNTPIKTDLKLRNGGILIYKEQIFMVTSSPNSNGAYCSFVKLSNGNKACTEPISRTTTYQRALAHLRNHNCYDVNELHYVGPVDYTIDISIGADSNIVEGADD